MAPLGACFDRREQKGRGHRSAPAQSPLLHPPPGRGSQGLLRGGALLVFPSLDSVEIWCLCPCVSHMQHGALAHAYAPLLLSRTLHTRPRKARACTSPFVHHSHLLCTHSRPVSSPISPLNISPLCSSLLSVPLLLVPALHAPTPPACSRMYAAAPKH